MSEAECIAWNQGVNLEPQIELPLNDPRLPTCPYCAHVIGAEAHADITSKPTPDQVYARERQFVADRGWLIE